MVLKIGGTAFANLDRLLPFLGGSERVIIVVSAPGRIGQPYATATLLSLFTELTKRELDNILPSGELIGCYLLLQHLRKNNLNATVLPESGIITDDNYGSAQVIGYDSHTLMAKLREERIIILPGFQGRDQAGNKTTLGRGGSDLSALVIAKMIKEEKVKLLKEVRGIHPLLDLPIIHQQLSYQQALLIGGGVVQEQALLWAQKEKITIAITDLDSGTTGTIINEQRGNHRIIKGEYQGEYLFLHGDFEGIDTKDIIWKLRNSSISYQELALLGEVIKIRISKELAPRAFECLFYYLKYQFVA